MNDNLGVCIVCPISSNQKNYASCVPLKKKAANGLSVNSEIITFQIRTVSKERFIKKIGEIITEEYEEIMAGLSDVLRY